MKGNKMFPYLALTFFFRIVFASEVDGLRILREEEEEDEHTNLTWNMIDVVEDELMEINTEIADDEGSNLLLYLGIGLLLTLEVIAGIIVSVYYIRGRTVSAAKATPLTKREIDEFLTGVPVQGAYSPNLNDAQSGSRGLAIIESLPYDRSKEVVLRDFQIDTFNIGSKGEFGITYKGTFINRANPTNFNDYEKIPIRVKTASDKSNADGLRSLMKEVKVIMHVGKHKRLVNMMGCCTGKLREGKLYLLLENCENGTLKTYLQKHKSSPFGSILLNEQILKWKKRKVPDEEDDNVEWDEGKIDNFQMIRWCAEIAEGMEFLNGKKVIHGDLSTRNVLLDKRLHVKLTDFGTCNWLYYYNQYIETNREPLPWRWLPIETLKNMEFTLKSDVWMFGVTCWEIFSLGEKPYSDVKWGREFMQNLDSGVRLSKPDNCTIEWYNTMTKGWERDPRKRPSFSEILRILLGPPNGDQN